MTDREPPAGLWNPQSLVSTPPPADPSTADPSTADPPSTASRPADPPPVALWQPVPADPQAAAPWQLTPADPPAAVSWQPATPIAPVPAAPAYDPAESAYDPAGPAYDAAESAYDPAGPAYDAAESAYDPAETAYDAGGAGYLGRLAEAAALAGRRRLMIVLAGLGAIVLVAGVITAVVQGTAGTREPAAQTQTFAPLPEPGDGGGETADVAPTETEVTPTVEPTLEETTDPEQAALAQLAELHDQDLSTVTFDGRYAAQLASKNPGISDPYQWAADGSHVFQASDILAEHQELRAGDNGGAEVILLRSTDYGKRQLYNGEPLWVTFALGDFPAKQDVLDWCAARFPALSGEELANQCAARKLEPAP